MLKSQHQIQLKQMKQRKRLLPQMKLLMKILNQQIEQHLTELIQEGDQNTINLDHLIFQMMKWIK